MNYYYAVCLFIISFISSGWLTWYLIKYLNFKQIIDTPEARSNHKTPKPRGGGIATIMVFSILYPLFSYFAFNEYYQPIIISIFVLLIGSLGFIDDIISLRVSTRFSVQLVIIGFMLFILFPDQNLILPNNINNIWDKLLLLLFVTYFVNIYNFMDGIDGITASNTITTLLGVIAIIITHKLDLNSVIYLNIILIACSLSFLLFNWYPSKIFYGDVGSLSLGLITAFTLLKIAYQGYFWFSLIIAGYYLFDASFTIVKRLVAGEKIWEAHSKHFYQLAVRKGYSHSQVVMLIILINMVLIIIATMIIPRASIPIL